MIFYISFDCRANRSRRMKHKRDVSRLNGWPLETKYRRQKSRKNHHVSTLCTMTCELSGSWYYWNIIIFTGTRITPNVGLVRKSMEQKNSCPISTAVISLFSQVGVMRLFSSCSWKSCKIRKKQNVDFDESTPHHFWKHSTSV